MNADTKTRASQCHLRLSALSCGRCFRSSLTLILFALPRSALPETDRGGAPRQARDAAPTLAPLELDLGRVYRGVTRAFTLRAESSPGAELTLDISPPVTPAGGRAVGVSIRTPGRKLTSGADGKLTIECEAAVGPKALLGPAGAKVTLTDAAGRRAEARVRFVVSKRALRAPERLDFGEVFIKGTARAELPLRIEGPQAVSAWLEWFDLRGESAEILRAFVRVEDRAVELPPEAEVKVPVRIELPRGTRPGGYRGRLTVTAGPFRADVELGVSAILPRIAAEPGLVDLGAVAAGDLAVAGFVVKLEGAAPERFEAELEGPLSKTARSEAILECLEVEADDDEIAPGDDVNVRLFGTVPAGQEDGLYEGVMVLRAGASRLRVPVRIDVPRPEGLPAFEIEPPELLLRARRGENSHTALRVRSNVDRLLKLEASLTPPADPRWTVEFMVEFQEESLSPDEYAFFVPARGEAEIAIVARAPEGAPLGERVEARVEVATVDAPEGETGRSDVILEVARAAPKPEPVRPSPVGRIALGVFALACALTVAASWKVRPLRYGATSAGVHALVLAFGVRAPFMSAPSRAAGGERVIAIRVIQLEDPFGEELPGEGEGRAAALAPGGEEVRPPEVDAGEAAVNRGVPSKGESPAEVAAAARARRGAPGGAHAPVPSHPDARAKPELRESLEIARAPVRSPGPPAVRDSDGFDLEGPEATLSLVESGRSGEIRRARLSGRELFGAAWREHVPGVFARGEANLIEEIPVGALAAAIEEVETRGPAPGLGRTAAAAPRISHPGRERVELAGPSRWEARWEARREARRATLAIARPERPEVPVERPGLPARRRRDDLPIETEPELAAPENLERVLRPARTRPHAARPPRPASRQRGRRPRPDAPEARRPLTPVKRADLRRERPPLPVPVARARGLVERWIRERPPGSVADPLLESLAEKPSEPSGPPRRTPPETRGRQTITRARGRSPAGIAGRLEESRARPGPAPVELPSMPAPLVRTGRGVAASKLLNPSRGSLMHGRVRALRAGVTFGILKHAGDWNVSPRAMGALARELPARQPGFDLEVRSVPVRATEDELLDCALLYITGRRAPSLSEGDIERLARYLERGGFIWVDDGAAPGNNTFDRAARRLLGSLVPGGSVRRVPFSNEIFTCSYDLARGYLGRALPGGAWVRQDELVGLFTPEGELVAVYTRNGYGLAMETDPNRGALLRPPPGLTPREAREGALRAGVNIAVAALRRGGRPLPEGRAREAFDPSLRYRYRGERIEPARGVWEPAEWREMRGSGPVKLGRRKGGLLVEFVASEKDWAGVESRAPGGMAAARAVIFDVECIMHAPARVALRMRTRGGALYESVPLYVHPGLNENLRVSLGAAEFRSTGTGWRAYDAMPDRSKPPARIGFVFYGRDLFGGRDKGSAILENLRFEGWGASSR